MVQANDFSFLILILISFVLVKAGFEKKVFDYVPKLLFTLCYPAIILVTFSNMDGGSVLQHDALFIVVFAVVYTLIAYFTSRFAMRRYKNEGRRPIIVLNMIVGNVTFIGLPFISYFFGNWGVVFAILLNIVQDFFVWSICYWMFAPKGGIKQTLKNVFNPCFVAVIIGLFLAGTQHELPAFLAPPVHMLADMTIPIALLCIGSLLAQNTNMLKFIDKEAAFVIVARIFLLPALVFTILTIIGIDRQLVLISSFVTALPAPLLSVILSKEFKKDITFATAVFTLSTLIFILLCIALFFLQSHNIFSIS